VAVPFTSEQVDLLTATRTELVRGHYDVAITRLQSLLAPATPDT
jgi:hypothetical protein